MWENLWMKINNDKLHSALTWIMFLANQFDVYRHCNTLSCRDTEHFNVSDEFVKIPERGLVQQLDRVMHHSLNLSITLGWQYLDQVGITGGHLYITYNIYYIMDCL